ncbi:DUF1097 domain-containing protein [uncultured Ilyobacter sp.]|uniref:DUF1097 domain-containing protein n=1 Tax=uncultured Ilyobacter sp. TaxID=544433 RepID=UPI0029C0F982|nr:DUF1097 domain-containing protein [uncultured Ilyobacter sp.]
MTKKEYIVGPIIVAVIAMSVQVIDQTSILNILAIGAGFGWVSFQAWACYFLAGCTPKGGIRTFNSYLLGCIASIAIMILGGTLSQVLGFFGFPIAILICVVPVICLEKSGEWFDFVPALFIGAGAFFGFMSYVPGATYVNATVTIMIYCLLGLLAGYFTILFRTKYEMILNK